MDWQEFAYFLVSPSQERLVIALSIYAAILAILLIHYRMRIRAYEIAAQAAEKGTMKQQEITAITAHELKNPLAVARLYAELLSRTDERARVIVQECDRMTDIINKHLDYAKLVNANFHLERQTVSPCTLLRKRVLFMQALDRHHLYEFKKLGDDKCELQADPLSIERIMVNLLTNASRYSPADTKITAQCTSLPSATIISISDHGEGITPAVQPLLFNPFTRGTRTGHGLGLGLYVCKQLTELHGGHISFTTGSHGTTFLVQIPKQSDTIR